MNVLHIFYSDKLNKKTIENIWSNNDPIIIYITDPSFYDVQFKELIGRENIMIVNNKEEMQNILEFYELYDYYTLERKTYEKVNFD